MNPSFSKTLGSLALLLVIGLGAKTLLSHPAVLSTLESTLNSTKSLTAAVISYTGFDGPAELPRAYVDTTMPVQTGTTINVPSGGDLQTALNNAKLGDTIMLQAGGTYTGNYILPAKTGSGWIIIRTNAPDSSLPPQGARINPSYAGVMAKLTTAIGGAPVIGTTLNTHNYRLIGLQIQGFGSAAGDITYNIVDLGTDSANNGAYEQYIQQQPNNIVLDRVWIHTNGDTQRCVAFNGRNEAVIDSYLSDCHGKGFDAQAIGGWNGPGPFKIVNNFLEGSGENILFGGADPQTRLNSDGTAVETNPSDIEIRENYIYKDPAWMNGVWTVKNNNECKNCVRELVEGNIFQNNWTDAQTGTMILYQSLTDGNTAPWDTVSDVTFRYNKLMGTENGMSIAGRVAYNTGGTTPLLPTNPSSRFSIHDNTLETSNIVFGLFDDHHNIQISHNTGFGTNHAIELDSTDGPAVGTVITDNIISHGQYGLSGSGTSEGVASLNAFISSYTVTNNIFFDDPNGDQTSVYPPRSFFPSLSAIGFLNSAAKDYHLSASSPYKNAGTDGKDLGADIDALNTATAGAISGVWDNSTIIIAPPPLDTTPPAILSGSPSGNLVSSATSATLSVQTNEAATCKYSTTPNQSYASIPATFTTTGSFSHSVIVSGLGSGSSYTYYVRCQDASGNADTSDFPISFSISAPSTPGGPLLWYKFDEGSGATTADSSGNGLSGAVSASWNASGKYGSALSFNPATNDKVAVTGFPTLTSALTAEAWIKPSSDANTADWIILDKNNAEFDLRLSGGRLNTGVANQSLTETDFNYNDPANANQWYHVALTYNQAAQTMQLYRNGVLVASGPNTGTVTNSDTPLWIGRQAQFNFGTFDGSIDEVKIFDVARTAAQIQADMLASSVTPPPSGDTTAPSTPTNLSATAASASQINLSWTASTDNVAVVGYKVFRGSTQIGTSATTVFNDAGLAPSFAYTYRISALDAAGNISAQTSVVTATTLALPSGATGGGGGGGGGGSTATSPTYTTVSTGGGGGGGTTVAAPDTTYQDLIKAITALVLQNRTLLLKAESQGITLSPLILQILGTAPAATTSPTASTGYTRDLTLGSEGSDVTSLQNFLIGANKGPEARALKNHGATDYFGSLTKFALAEYQYASGISPASGYFGVVTRTKIEK